MIDAIKKFIKDEDGLTMVEYAIAGGLIVLGGVAAFQALGTNVATNITGIATEVENANPNG